MTTIDTTDATKTCPGCGLTKPLAAFSPRTRGGYESRCRECEAQRTRARINPTLRSGGTGSTAFVQAIPPAPDYSLLRYDYTLIDEAQRLAVQEAAIAIRGRERRMVEDMLAIGEQLLVIRDLLPRGEFVNWIRTEFGWSNGSAYDFINMASRAGHFSKFGNLGITCARLLSPPSVPDVVVADVIELNRARLEDDMPELTVREVKELIRTAKPRPEGSRPPPKQVKKLTSVVVEPEPATIEAEYTLIRSEQDSVTLTLDRSLAHKLHAAVLIRALRYQMTWDEQEQIIAALGRALE